MTRRITYVEALNEAIHQAMDGDPRVMLLGQGVNNPWYVGQTMKGVYARFGPDRVVDPPVSEQAMNGVVIGAALSGMRPVVVHPRMDFMLIGLEQIINQAANWSYMFAGQASVPLVIWAIINRGGEQGAQHSQAVHAMLAHIPGLKVVMPATPYDVKGLMLAAINDPNPVAVIDERLLYSIVGEVPEAPYEVEIGKAQVMREGRDVTVVATSHMVWEAMAAADELSKDGVSVEVVNLRSLKPLDKTAILQSVGKTHRLLVADGGWKTYGISGEVIATVAEVDPGMLKSPVARVCLPDLPAPSSRALEQVYYPSRRNIIAAVTAMLARRHTPVGARDTD